MAFLVYRFIFAQKCVAMKKVFLYGLGSLFVCSWLLACEDGVVRQLDGKWQLRQVEQEGVVTTVDTVWYNFQNSLFQYQIYQPSAGRMLGVHGYTTLSDDNHLILELTHTGQLTEFLMWTDWISPRREFAIRTHPTSLLVLESEGKTYTFRRY